MLLATLRILGLLFVVYVVFVLLLSGCQRQMLYYPVRTTEEQSFALARDLGLEAWRGPDGELMGWRMPREASAGEARVALVFHGNAGFALNRGYFVQGFSRQQVSPPWSVYLFEYPGYGARPGRPSAAHFKEAAESALHAILAEKPASILLVGESIGSGVASHLAGKFPDEVDGLLLLTPFDSLHSVARSHFPYVPTRLLLRERFDNSQALESFSGPLAVVLAGNDEIIPVRFGERLYTDYDGPKRIWVQPGRGHNELDYYHRATWWQELEDFLQVHGFAVDGQD